MIGLKIFLIKNWKGENFGFPKKIFFLTFSSILKKIKFNFNTRLSDSMWKDGITFALWTGRIGYSNIQQSDAQSIQSRDCIASRRALCLFLDGSVDFPAEKSYKPDMSYWTVHECGFMIGYLSFHMPAMLGIHHMQIRMLIWRQFSANLTRNP